MSAAKVGHFTDIDFGAFEARWTAAELWARPGECDDGCGLVVGGPCTRGSSSGFLFGRGGLKSVCGHLRVDVNIHVTDHLPKEWTQVRFPKSKRKRIRKKWAKDQRNYSMVETVAMMVVNGQHMMSPKSFATLTKTLDAEGQEVSDGTR